MHEEIAQSLNEVETTIRKKSAALLALKSKRNWFAIIGTLIMVSLWILTDPDAGIMHKLPFGAKIFDIFAVMSKGIIYILMLHYSRTFIFEYLSLRRVIAKAVETPEGAGMVAISAAIFTLAFAIAVHAAVAAG